MKTIVEKNKGVDSQSRFRYVAEYKLMSANEFGAYTNNLVAHGSTEQQALENLRLVIKSVKIVFDDELKQIDDKLYVKKENVVSADD